MSSDSQAMRDYYRTCAFPKPGRTSDRKSQRADERKAMKAYLASHPVCEKKGCRKKSVEVHHTIPRGMGGSRDSLTRDEKHWAALCQSCHVIAEGGRIGKETR